MLAKFKDRGAIPKHVDYPLSVWTFDDDLLMVFLAGEVVVDYSVRLNRQLDWSRLWITAWANDMPGYIPSRRVLQEGGYEADFSQVYYALPTRYDPAVEDVLVKAIMQLVDPRFKASPDQQEVPFHKMPSGEQQTFDRLTKWAAEPKAEAGDAVLRRVRQLIPQAAPAVSKMTRNDGERTEWLLDPDSEASSGERQNRTGGIDRACMIRLLNMQSDGNKFRRTGKTRSRFLDSSGKRSQWQR